MTFRGKMWERHGNHYTLVGTEIQIYQWNSGKDANFLVTAGFRNSNHIEKSFQKGSRGKRQGNYICAFHRRQIQVDHRLILKGEQR